MSKPAAAILLLLLLLLLAGAMAWQGINGAIQVGGTADGAAVDVRIGQGAGAAAIADTLHHHGVISSPLWFRMLVMVRGAEHDLRAGAYRFQGRLSKADVLEILLSGPPAIDHKCTIREGLTVKQTMQRLADAGLGTVENFQRAIEQSMDLVHGFDPASTNAEGYLFPDTYRFAQTAGEGEIIRTMLYRFINTAARIMGRTPACAGGLSVREAATLGSLVEKETGLATERALVAGVFANRLRIGMRLQCDPTVIYSIERDGRPVDRLLLVDLQYDSPWNTYRYAGLPPGPICCPGADALAAACAPAKTSALYFVADGRGGHAFSRTIGEHNRAVARFRVWQRRNR